MEHKTLRNQPVEGVRDLFGLTRKPGHEIIMIAYL